jgi:hypothetical protein
MVRKSYESTRYGIGEWYGRRIETISASDRKKYAKITGINKESCPHRPGKDLCNKSGGVCSLAIYLKEEDGTVILDPDNPDLVTLCPMRFWQNYTIEMQAVYFSGQGMKTEFKAIEDEPTNLLFPTAIRRPDFRSSGPKRLMPQLQIKVPALRRWGKTMAVVIDKSFFASIAPMRRAPHISNADIAWFVVNYDGPQGELRVSDIVLTTLESSVEGLTAGEPITKEEFEKELSSYLAGRQDKIIRLS